MSESDTVLTDGCFCGHERYRNSANPIALTPCHCTRCWRLTGVPLITWMTLTLEKRTKNRVSG